MQIFNTSILPPPQYFYVKAPTRHLLFSIIHLLLSVPFLIPSSPTTLTLAHVALQGRFCSGLERWNLSLWEHFPLGALFANWRLCELWWLGECGMHTSTFYKSKPHFFPLIPVRFSSKFCSEVLHTTEIKIMVLVYPEHFFLPSFPSLPGRSIPTAPKLSFGAIVCGFLGHTHIGAACHANRKVKSLPREGCCAPCLDSRLLFLSSCITSSSLLLSAEVR